MARQVYWLSDAEWRRIEPLLPRARRRAHRVDDRRAISDIVYILRCKHPRRYDEAAHKGHNAIERMFRRLKDFQRIATRYDKRANIFLSAVLLAAALIWRIN